MRKQTNNTLPQFHQRSFLARTTSSWSCQATFTIHSHRHPSRRPKRTVLRTFPMCRSPHLGSKTHAGQPAQRRRALRLMPRPRACGRLHWKERRLRRSCPPWRKPRRSMGPSRRGTAIRKHSRTTLITRRTLRGRNSMLRGRHTRATDGIGLVVQRDTKTWIECAALVFGVCNQWTHTHTKAHEQVGFRYPLQLGKVIVFFDNQVGAAFQATTTSRARRWSFVTSTQPSASTLTILPSTHMRLHLPSCSRP